MGLALFMRILISPKNDLKFIRVFDVVENKSPDREFMHFKIYNLLYIFDSIDHRLYPI